MTPEEYVISKFKDHDVVFLGEPHYVKQHVQLVQHLIPLCYQNGVYALCVEFARRVDQPLIDSLLNGTQYSESLAREITFRQFVHWGFQEYVDLYKVAWQLNHSLPTGARGFRILGLNDSPDWSFVKTESDRDNDEIKRKVWRGGGEEYWAAVILDSVVAEGEKALVFSGMHHAFTEYKQPVYDSDRHQLLRLEDRRMGNKVYDRIGKRAITICLHYAWPGSGGYEGPLVCPADGFIDAVMASLRSTCRPVGFDTRGTPFGELTGETSVYHYGYIPFTLEQFCDGYIYFVPLSNYEGVTPIKDFVNEGNLDCARQQSPSPRFRKATAEDFYQTATRESDVAAHYESFR
jgi:uncharacterized iron-regulated protein